MSNTNNRREFLKTSSSALLSLPIWGSFTTSLWSQLVHADSVGVKGTQPNVLVIRMLMALDNVEGISPWLGSQPDHKDLALSYTKDKLTKTNTQLVFAPAASALAPFAKNSAVIHGVFMGPNDLGHPFAQQYITSGRAQESAPHFSTIVAHSRRKNNDFLMLNDSVESGTNEFSILQTNVLQEGFSVISKSASGALDMIQNQSQGVASLRKLQERHLEVERFNSLLPQVLALRSHEVNSIESVPKVLDEECVAAAFISGLATTAQIDFDESIGESPDTHARHIEDHPKAQKTRWDRMANLLNILKKFNVLDNTLIIAVTDFSRTPALNANMGKDHNYFTNSVFLAGYGINGGTSIGSQQLHPSSSKRGSLLVGDFIDYKTGEIKRFKNINPSNVEQLSLPVGVDLIRPRDVLRTLQEIVLPGSESRFGTKSKVLPKIVKN